MQLATRFGLTGRAIALCVFLLLGTVVPLSTFLLWHTYRDALSDVTTYALLHAETIGHLAEPAIVLNDHEAVARVVQAAPQPTTVLGVAIVDANGRQLVGVQPVADFAPEADIDLRDPAQRPQGRGSHIVRRTADRLTVAVPIWREPAGLEGESRSAAVSRPASGDTPLGYVCLTYTLADIRREIAARILSIGLLSSLVLSVATAMTLLAMRPLLRPLRDLVQAAAAIAQGHRTRRASERAVGEVGELARAFNDMADRLQEGYASVEQRVEERTRALEAQKVELEREMVERQRAEQSLRASEERFRQAFEHAPIGMAVADLQGRWLSVNPALCSITGRSAEELLAKDIQSITHPADRTADEEHCRRLLAGEIVTYQSEKRFVHKRRHIVWVHVAVSLLRDASGRPAQIIGQIQDITARKRAEAALRESLERFDLMVQGTRAGLWDATYLLPDKPLDPEAPIYYSPMLKELLGFAADEFEGVVGSFLARLHPDDRERVRQAMEDHLFQRQPYDIEYRAFTKDGEMRWFHSRGQAIWDTSGRPVRFSGSTMDITPRKQVEEALRDKTEQISAALAREQQTSIRLEAAKQQLEIAAHAADAANRAKSEFLANISHEIRTPLTAILGFSDLLRQGADAGNEIERQDWVETIFTSGQHLFNLLNDILDLSKIEAGRMEVERVPIKLPQLIAEVVSIMRVPAAKKSLKVEVQNAGDLPASIMSDPTRLRQVLVNLVGNAIKFTDKGRVTISTRLDADQDWPRLFIQVIDTGIGIPRDKLPALFEPFVQADASITRKYGGTGLGLAISRRLAQALGGQITVESEVGRGSTFTVEIDPGPLEKVQHPSPDTTGIVARPPPPAPRAAGPTLSGRILLVEDGATNRKLIGLILRRAGATVSTAENGQVGIELALREPFDVILMDMQMPVLDGSAATRRLRERGVQIPIIALTAHTRGDAVQGFLESGCSGYLAKPANPEELIRAVAKALSQRPTAESAPLGGATEPPAGPRPLLSTLPMDDPEFREIVAEFIVRLEEQLAAMRVAFEIQDWTELTCLAHWLKGSGSTVGFATLAEAAAELEQQARGAASGQIEHSLAILTDLAARICVGPVQSRSA